MLEIYGLSRNDLAVIDEFVDRYAPTDQKKNASFDGTLTMNELDMFVKVIVNANPEDRNPNTHRLMRSICYLMPAMKMASALWGDLVTSLSYWRGIKLNNGKWADIPKGVNVREVILADMYGQIGNSDGVTTEEELIAARSLRGGQKCSVMRSGYELDVNCELDSSNPRVKKIDSALERINYSLYLSVKSESDKIQRFVKTYDTRIVDIRRV